MNDPDPTWAPSPGEEPLAPRRRGGWPPRDATGMVHFHRFNAITMFRAVPSMINVFNTIVPEDFWTRDEESGELIAVVACPCGEEPKVGVAQTAECACGRFFLGMGDEVRVFNPNAQDSRSGS